MTTTAVAFLGAIAVATVLMALIQVGAIVFAARMALRLEKLMGRLERDLQPTIDRVTAISSEASRAATLAADQVARVDRLVTEVGRRADHTVNHVRHALARPAREGAAVAAGVRAAAESLREARRRRRGSPGGDDDPLFIG